MRKICHERHFMTYFLFTGIFLVASLAVLAEGVGEIEAWGNGPGLVEPHPDSKGRAGYWWWPRSRAEDASEISVGGNRGRVFGAWKQPREIFESNEPAPPPPVVMPLIECGGPILNNVLFDFDESTITIEAKAEIDKLVAEMKKYDGDTTVCIGHTDDVGPEKYNFQLGLRRAQAVMDYMVKRGIAADRIEVRSHGEAMPVVPNDSKANRALNRRVVFDITYGD